MELTKIRELVTKILHSLGLGHAKPRGERPLHCDRYYVGVRFEYEGVAAIWLTTAGQVRFVDDSGRLLKIVSACGHRVAA